MPVGPFDPGHEAASGQLATRNSCQNGERDAYTRVQAVPIHIKEANAFVLKCHRHSLPTVGGKFAVRAWHDGKTLEMLRVCTDGTPNACSFLISNRVRWVAHLLGYEKIVTYTLAEESGACLRAVGAKPVAAVESQKWSVPSRPRESQPVYAEKKVWWAL